MITLAAVLPKGKYQTYTGWDYTRGDGKCIVLVPLTVPRRKDEWREHEKPILILAHPDGSVAVHVDRAHFDDGVIHVLAATIRDFDLDTGHKIDYEAEVQVEPQQLSRQRAERLMDFITKYVL